MAGSDLYTGSLELLILKALTWGSRHGYAIGRWIRETTGEGLPVKEGALYPALHRLQRGGLLDEAWGLSDTGREVKLYTLTEAGREHLRQEIVRWNQYARLMELALTAGQV